MTIFISSHILVEISRIATRIGIIHEGRLEQLLLKRLVVNTLDNEAAQARLVKDGYAATVSGDGTLEIKGENPIGHPEAIATLLVHAGLPPTLLRVDEEDLESYFLRAIGQSGGVK